MKKTLNILLLSIMMVLTISTTNAESQNDQIKFTVSIVEPKEQEIKGSNYFHLSSTNGIKTKLLLRLSNISDEDIKVKAKLSNADTNANGLIEYDGSLNRNAHSSMKIPFEKIANVKDNIIQIKAKETTDHFIDIEADALNPDGIILGGINYSLVDENDKQGISNDYEYNVAVVLSNKKGQLHSSKTLEYIEAKNILENGQKFTVISFLNPEAQIMTSLDFDILVKDEKGKVIFDKKEKGFEMAPNSILDYKMNWEKELMKPGKYFVDIKANNKNNSWSWQDSFEIENAEANEINENSSNKYTTAASIKVISIILLVITVADLTYMKKKIDKENV